MKSQLALGKDKKEFQFTEFSRSYYRYEKLKKSDNQIADALFRAVAYNYYKRPASFQLGTLAVKSVLQKQGIKFW